MDYFPSSSSSSSSSIDSSSHPALSTKSSLSQPSRRDLSIDLRLGLSLSNSSASNSSSKQRVQLSDWPPIKPLLRSTIKENSYARERRSTLFVKVYMEGIPIGRKLDLLAHDGYQGLIEELCCMFNTSIMFPHIDQVLFHNSHVLTYEDREGDWMMVGDVPWELFLTTMKRLKITTVNKC